MVHKSKSVKRSDCEHMMILMIYEYGDDFLENCICVCIDAMHTGAGLGRHTGAVTAWLAKIRGTF